jgi:hypothetical protein
MEEKNYLTKINEVCTSPTVAVHFDSPGWLALEPDFPESLRLKIL